MLFTGFIIASIFITGIIHETRVWLILTPILIYLWYKPADIKIVKKNKK